LRGNHINSFVTENSTVEYEEQVQLSLKRMLQESKTKVDEPKNLWTFISTEFGAGSSTISQAMAAIMENRGETIHLINFGSILSAPVYWKSLLSETDTEFINTAGMLETHFRQDLTSIIKKTDFINSYAPHRSHNRLFLDIGPSFSVQAIDLFLISDMPLIITQASHQSLVKLDHLLRLSFIRLLDIYLPQTIRGSYIKKVRMNTFNFYDYTSMLEKLETESPQYREKLTSFIRQFTPRIILSKSDNSCNSLDILPSLSNHFLFHNLSLLGVVNTQEQKSRPFQIKSRFQLNQDSREDSIHFLEEKMQSWLYAFS